MRSIRQPGERRASVQAQGDTDRLTARPGQWVIDDDRDGGSVSALAARVQSRRDLGQRGVQGVVQQPLDPLIVGLVVEIDARDRGARRARALG